MYETMLQSVMGAFGTDAQITVQKPVDSSAEVAVVAGMVVSLNELGFFTPGLVAGGLPYFAKPAGGYDGLPPAGNAYGDDILAIPATAAAILATTEFVTTEDYANNTPLTVVNSGDDIGKLTPGVYYEDDILGVCVQGVQTDVDKPGRDMLEFHTYWLPSATALVAGLSL